MKSPRHHAYDLLGFIFLLGAITYCIVSFVAPVDGTYVYMKTPVCVEKTFTPQDFLLELHIQNIEHPDVVLRQACQESGFFSSSVWINKNNPFGFCYKGEYLHFNTWEESILYYKDWQLRHYKGGNYYSFLEDIHFSADSSYIMKLRGIDLTNLEKYKKINGR